MNAIGNGTIYTTAITFPPMKREDAFPLRSEIAIGNPTGRHPPLDTVGPVNVGPLGASER